MKKKIIQNDKNKLIAIFENNVVFTYDKVTNVGCYNVDTEGFPSLSVK